MYASRALCFGLQYSGKAAFSQTSEAAERKPGEELPPPVACEDFGGVRKNKYRAGLGRSGGEGEGEAFLRKGKELERFPENKSLLK